MSEPEMPDEPLSSASLAGLAKPEPAADAITVLVVDDERSNVESLEKIFPREGMRVLTAFDAKHALEQVRTHRVARRPHRPDDARARRGSSSSAPSSRSPPTSRSC